MRTLYLDLASHSGVIACVTEEKLDDLEEMDHRIDDAELTKRLENVMKKAGWSYQDLTNIACVTGPGGFTSLRVAVALANTLSSQLGIPVCGIHLSDVYRARAGARVRDTIWLHSTKKNEVFIRDGKKYPEPTCITLDELRSSLQAGMQWSGELIPEHRKIIDDIGLTEASLQPLEAVLSGFLKDRGYKKQLLTPWYGRGW